VPVTFRLFRHGLHGMGMATGDAGEVGTWPRQAIDWLVKRGLLARAG
jgi:hypothetical protein